MRHIEAPFRFHIFLTLEDTINLAKETPLRRLAS